MQSQDPRRLSIAQIRVITVSTRSEMEPYIPAWDDLSVHATEPNPFCESWAFMPAWKHLAGSLDIHVVLVFSDDSTRLTDQPLLLGLFPIATRLKHKTLRIRTVALWRHTHCPLGTPHLRRGYERAALSGLFDWLDRERGLGRMLSIELAGGDGPFFENLQTLVNDQKRQMFSYNEFPRAVFRPMVDPETYYSSVLSANRRKKFRQKYRALSNLGKLEVLELKPSDDLNDWLENFLALEASGWKGKQGSAIASTASDTHFFRELSRGAFNRGRLQLLKLQLDDRPAAMQYNLVSPQGAFCLKLAYDETHKRFSPGSLLAFEALKLLHGHPNIPWMDSCRSAPTSEVLEDLWIERRLIRHILVSTGDKIGKSILKLLPIAKWLHRTL